MGDGLYDRYTKRKGIQAYIDQLRAANPDLKGQSDELIFTGASRIWDPGYDNMSDPEQKAIVDIARQKVAKPTFTMEDFNSAADRGSGGWNFVKGLIEGVDPIGLYRPLYSENDAASTERSVGNVGGALSTMFVPVGGAAAGLLKAAKVGNLIKDAKQAALIGKAATRWLPTAVDALQAQSQYAADSQQLGTDYDIGTGAMLAATGGLMSKMGRAGQGVAGLKGKLMRGAPPAVLADAMMGTSPYITQNEEFKKTLAPLRYPKAIGMALGKAEDAGDVIGTLAGTIGMPAAFGYIGAKNVGHPDKLPSFAKPGGGNWDDPVGPPLGRPAAVAPPTAGATAAQGSPTQRVRELLGDAPPGSSVWDPAVADEVNRSSARYNLREAVNAANVEDQPKVFVIDPQTGDRMQMIRSMGGNSVIVGRKGETPSTMGVETARAMPMEAIIDVGKPGGTKAFIPPGFLPGYKDGPGGNQYRSFTLKDDQTGAESMALVVGHNSDTGEIVVLDTATGRTIKGHKSVFPEAAKIWAAPPEDKAGNIAKGMRADQRRHAGLEPHRMTNPADVLSAIEDARRRIGF